MAQIATAIVNGLLSFAKAIDSYKGSLKKAKEEQRAKLAAYFMDIRRCLVDIASKVEKGRKTSGYCKKLGMYVALLPSLLKGLLPDNVISDINQDLKDAQGIDSLYILETDYPESERAVQVAKLREAAGSLKAVADYLRKA